MGIPLPESVKKVLADKAYGHVLTYNADGSPQLTMVWMDVDGDNPTFNTAEGRIKPKNVRNDSRIRISVQDRNDLQAYMMLYGTAVVTEEGADEQIDKLAKRFLGLDEYPFRQPGETRLMIRMEVDKIRGMGPKMSPWA